jgi:hypothetical protein
MSSRRGCLLGLLVMVAALAACGGGSADGGGSGQLSVGESAVKAAADVLRQYPGLFRLEEIHSIENLRGIPVGSVNREIHLSEINSAWNEFYRLRPSPTRDEVLDLATEIDRRLGIFFDPPVQ